jgi:hypothetical protein
MEAFERCFIMLCDDRTEEECIRRGLFGDMARRFEYLDEVRPGDLGLLLNVNRDELIGVFRACSKAEMNIEPDAWKGRFAAQVRVEPIGELRRVRDATYILTKAGVAMGHLASGAPAPEYPVHGRYVAEKLMAHFRGPAE